MFKRSFTKVTFYLIDYGSVTWGYTLLSNIERLSKLQKRAACIILHADYTAPSDDMFKELGWLSISQRIKCNKAVLTYKTLYNLTQCRTLRSSVDSTLAVPRSRSSVFDRTFSYSAPQLWNTLPNTVRTSSSLNSFKNNLKQKLQSRPSILFFIF